MYVAKAAGRNTLRLLHRGDEHTRATEKSDVESALRACAQERNEFVLYYQPKVQIDTAEHGQASRR